METLIATSKLLFFKHKQYPLILGSQGISADKAEGDGTTPAGTFPLKRVFYRADRLPPFSTQLPCYPIQQNEGWSDDPQDPCYNQKVTLPHPYRHEVLWRKDHRYDLLVEVGYNDSPPIPGKGSAIFLHLIEKGASFTQGCLAFHLKDLLEMVLTLTYPSQILITDTLSLPSSLKR